MSDLRLTFSDVYNEVSRFLGWGTSPTGQKLTDAKAITHAGYRKFLYPIRVNPLTGAVVGRHTWSFLIKNAMLSLAGTKWQYVLPVNFDRMYTQFTYSSDDQYLPLKHVSAADILRRRSFVESSGAPHLYAIQPGVYDPEHGNLWEAWFYETPSQAYDLLYAYVIRPPQLVNSTDYFTGNDFSSEAILESALSVAELRWDGERGVHAEEADKLIQQLVVADTVITPWYHGVLYDPSISLKQYQRPLPTVEDAYPD